MDCVVNSGMVGERRERIPLSLDPGKKKKDEGMYDVEVMGQQTGFKTPHIWVTSTQFESKCEG